MEEADDFCLARGASLLNLRSMEQSEELQNWWEGRERGGGIVDVIFELPGCLYCLL